MRDCVLVIYKKDLFDGIARSIEEAFNDASIDVVCVDEEEIGGKSGIKGYVRAIRNFPALSGMYLKKFYKKYRIKKYREVSAEKDGKLKIISGLMQAMEKAENILYRFHPKAVICTTSKSLALMIAAKRNTGCSAPVCSCIYDFTKSKGLMDKECDKYLVATHEIAASLMRSGVDDGNIAVTGFPVSISAADRAEARKKLGITDDLPVVAVIGGRYGNGAAKEVLHWIGAYSEQMHAAVMTSGNRSMLRLAESLGESGIIALDGESGDMEKLYSACDVALVSPTPYIVAECAALRIPTILLPPCNAQEKAAYKYLIGGGYCLQGDTQLKATAAVQELLMDGNYYMKYASAIGKLCEKGGYDGVRFAIEKLLAENVGDVFGRDSGDDSLENADEGKEAKEDDSQLKSDDNKDAPDDTQNAEAEDKKDKKKGFKLFGRK